MADVSWEKYITKTKSRGPRDLLIEAAGYVSFHDCGNALDLGAGAMNDTKYLLEIFEQVTAVDYEDAAAKCAKEIKAQNFFFFQQRFEVFHLRKSAYNLVNAAYALPFLPPSVFTEVWDSVIESLRPRGIFVGQLFGDRDTWNVKGSGNTFHTKEEARALFSGVELLKFVEEEEDSGSAFEKKKHWHIFHFIARKLVH